MAQEEKMTQKTKKLRKKGPRTTKKTNLKEMELRGGVLLFFLS